MRQEVSSSSKVYPPIHAVAHAIKSNRRSSSCEVGLKGCRLLILHTPVSRCMILWQLCTQAFLVANQDPPKSSRPTCSLLPVLQYTRTVQYTRMMDVLQAVGNCSQGTLGHKLRGPLVYCMHHVYLRYTPTLSSEDSRGHLSSSTAWLMSIFIENIVIQLHVP